VALFDHAPAVAVELPGEERDEVGKRLERSPEQRRQDGVAEQGEGSLATLAGDVGARERLPPAFGAAVQPDPEKQALGGGLAAAACRNATLKGRSTANSCSSVTVGI
jgi:hypothetical protein